MFAGNFAPVGWAFCSGQLIPIAENDALFNLIGTTYGGDGQQNFALPNLQSRVPVHQGQGSGLSICVIGQMYGVEAVTVTQQQLPTHTHPLTATSAAGNNANANNNMLSADPSSQLYTQDVASVQLAANAIGPVGGSQPHDNIQPFLVVNYIISLYGIYPTQN
jgi:microcystin-dependent protein